MVYLNNIQILQQPFSWLQDGIFLNLDSDIGEAIIFSDRFFDAPDFLCEKDGKVEWIWALLDEVTADDIKPYEAVEYPGGLYAVSVSRDGDGESHEKVRDKVAKWLANTNFVPDNTRALMGHMIYVDEEIKEGLGYHQMNLYTPIKLKKDSITGATGLC